jgi:Tfp pilus assembly protein PilO
MSRPPNARLYLGLAGFTFLGSVGFLFVQNQKLDSQRGEVIRMREQSREQTQLNAKLESTKKDLADLKDKLSHLEEGIPDAAYVPTLLKDLETVGKQHGIDVTGLRPVAVKAQPTAKDKDTSDVKPYQPLDLELKGRGRYFDLVTFIEALNVFPQIVAVRTLGLTPASNGPKEETRHLEITIGLRAFVFKQPPVATSPAGRTS